MNSAVVALGGVGAGDVGDDGFEVSISPADRSSFVTSSFDSVEKTFRKVTLEADLLILVTTSRWGPGH